MNKKILITLIILIVVIIGFVIGLIIPELTACTLKGCPCQNKIEIPCNKCSFYDPIFLTGIINFGKVCSAQEIIICENNQYVDRRIDIDNDSCKYKLTSFFVSLFKEITYQIKVRFFQVEEVSVPGLAGSGS